MKLKNVSKTINNVDLYITINIKMKIKDTVNIFFLLSIICLGCKKTNSIKAFKNPDKTFVWLSIDSNYVNKKKYQRTFLKEYNHQIQNNNKINAQRLLYNYGKILYKNETYDSLYFKICKKFYSKNNFLVHDKKCISLKTNKISVDKLG